MIEKSILTLMNPPKAFLGKISKDIKKKTSYSFEISVGEVTSHSKDCWT